MSRYKELIGLEKLVPALAGAFGLSYFVFDQVTYRKIFGGTKMVDMPTMSQEFQMATEARFLACERESTSQKVVMAPITQGIPPSYYPPNEDDEDDEDDD